MKKTNFYSHFLRMIAMAITALSLTFCEKDITLDLPDPPSKVVVEGWIESGAPPIVLLNRNFRYFGTITYDLYQNAMVHDAIVTVSDGTSEVVLPEICWSSLTEEQKELFGNFAGNALPDSLADSFDFCVYAAFPPLFIGEHGKTYTLHITTADGEQLSAVTTIPMPVPIDSFWIQKHNSPDYADSLRRIYAQFSDPDTMGNYYRYETQRNSEPMYPGLRSAYDDLIINGKTFQFPIDRAIPRGTENDIDFNAFGYFYLGDTVTIKWITIDRQTYDFWHTLEQVANSA